MFNETNPNYLPYQYVAVHPYHTMNYNNLPTFPNNTNISHIPLTESCIQYDLSHLNDYCKDSYPPSIQIETNPNDSNKKYKKHSKESKSLNMSCLTGLVNTNNANCRDFSGNSNNQIKYETNHRQQQKMNMKSMKITFNNASRKKTNQWTISEDRKLIKAIGVYGTDNWVNISKLFEGRRSRSQCSQRWYRVLNPRISKVQWTAEEDRKLIKIIDDCGETCWTRVAAILGNRCDVQCRYRYRQLMKSKSNLTKISTASTTDEKTAETVGNHINKATIAETVSVITTPIEEESEPTLAMNEHQNVYRDSLSIESNTFPLVMKNINFFNDQKDSTRFELPSIWEFMK